MENSRSSLESLLPSYTDLSLVSSVFQESFHKFLFFNSKVGLYGTSFFSQGIYVLAELQFLYKVAAPCKAKIKADAMEEEEYICPNFVTVTQGVPRLVQEPPPPGLTDSEISEDDSEEEEEEEVQVFQMGNFLAGAHGVVGF